MSDTWLRELHRQYLLGQVTAKTLKHALERMGLSPTWEWLAGRNFYQLGSEEKIRLFLERWPDPSPNTIEDISNIRNFNGILVWEDIHPDCPGVGETLIETLDSVAYYYSNRQELPFWIDFSQWISEEIPGLHRLIRILRQFGHIN